MLARKNLFVILISIFATQAVILDSLPVRAGETGSYGGNQANKTKVKRPKKIASQKKSTIGGINLAGDKGKVRYRPDLNIDDPCEKMFQKYKNARGHSAYATNYSLMGSDGFFCGVNLNSGSIEQAERGALASCENGKKKYKIRIPSKCTIAASK